MSSKSLSGSKSWLYSGISEVRVFEGAQFALIEQINLLALIDHLQAEVVFVQRDAFDLLAIFGDDRDGFRIPAEILWWIPSGPRRGDG